jgi:filamentous hemagglutinin family protein
VTAALLTTATGGYAGAGIATDGRVGPARTIAAANAGPGPLLIQQNLGAVAGSNLFHSFSRFNIDAGQTARFETNTAAIANVISRVTGGTASEIFGRLQLASPAGSAPAFFFINPAGVVFGAGATIDVPGAFHVSTADYLKFANGDRFYADPGRTSTLSSAAPEAFGFLGTNRAGVTVKDGGSLAMKSAQPISIVAGDVEINGATVSTRGGDTRVVAVGNAVQEIGFTGALPATSGELTILNAGRIDSRSVGATDSGSIAISAGDITIDSDYGYDYTGIFNLAQGANAGPINVRAASIAIDGRGYGGYLEYLVGIFSQAWGGSGNAGNVEVSTTGSISLVNGGQISADTFSDGNAGKVTVLHAGSISIDGQGSYVKKGYGYGYTGILSNADKGSTGNAGSVDVSTAGKLDIRDGGVLSTDTFSSGSAGTVKVRAGSISVDKKTRTSSSDTGIFSRAMSSSTTGSAGSIDVATTGKLSLDNGGEISSATLSSVSASAVKVSAGSIAIERGSRISSDTRSSGDGGTVDVSTTGGLSIDSGGQISSDTYSSGNAGTVEVRSGGITISRAGAISSSTISSGNAGTIVVRARNIAIDGVNQEGISTGIFSESSAAGEGPSGHGGDIAVTADSLSLSRGGTISALNGANSRGGTINLQVKHIALTEGGVITALTSGQGNAGDIIIQQADDLVISGVGNTSFTRDYDGQVVTGQFSGIYLNSQGSGNGGNLQLTTKRLTLSDGGLISAIAVDGKVSSLPETRAGNIHIDAGTIVLSDGGGIDASTSGAGKAGSVTVNADTSITIAGKFDHAAHPTVTNQLLSDQSHIGSSASYTLNKSAKALGAGGDVTVTTPTLILTNGGQIGVNTEGAGRAGSIQISAGTLLVDGHSSQISAAAAERSSGQTGSVSVTANEITISNGGQISIENRATVADPSVLVPTAITVTAPTITIVNSPAAISSNSTGNVAAGAIRIVASDTLRLDPSGITTTANQGNGGSIDISTGLFWLENSQIATSVRGLSGNGGNITISAESLIMNTGFIQANTAAANASGGLVSITVDNLIASGGSLFLGGNTPHSYQPGVFGFNVIQAAAPTGVNGVVQISSPRLDLTSSLIGLDTRLLNAQVARRLCGNSGGSSLVPVGRGGLPLVGADYLSPGQISGLDFIASPVASIPVVLTSWRTDAFAPCLASL